MSDVQKQSKSVLGRGLTSLLKSSEQTVTILPIDKLSPSRSQPRKFFSDLELNELAASIQAKGVLQPILVRYADEERYGTEYEIIAGERRWRASKIAQLKEIPVIVRHFDDTAALEVGLIENTQRLDLNPIEEADGYQRLIAECNHTQETLSKMMGKSRSHIANILRLLTLPESVQQALKEGKLSVGHGRALVGAADAELLAAKMIQEGLSVREAEILGKSATQLEKEESPSPANSEKEALKAQLSELLGAPIELALKGGGGKIVIPFKTPGDLDNLLEKFSKLKPPRSPEFRIWSV